MLCLSTFGRYEYLDQRLPSSARPVFFDLLRVGGRSAIFQIGGSSDGGKFDSYSLPVLMPTRYLPAEKALKKGLGMKREIGAFIAALNQWRFDVFDHLCKFHSNVFVRSGPRALLRQALERVLGLVPGCVWSLNAIPLENRKIIIRMRWK